MLNYVDYNKYYLKGSYMDYLEKLKQELIDPELKSKAFINGIKKIIFSGPCTIILWHDGTKTIVRCGPDDKFDPEKGIAMCILKKMFGSSHQMSKWMKEQIGEAGGN